MREDLLVVFEAKRFHVSRQRILRFHALKKEIEVRELAAYIPISFQRGIYGLQKKVHMGYIQLRRWQSSH